MGTVQTHYVPAGHGRIRLVDGLKPEIWWIVGAASVAILKKSSYNPITGKMEFPISYHAGVENEKV